MTLTSKQCKCTHCGEQFTTLRGFDRHRKGSFRDRGIHRHCLTVAEMLARGWAQIAGRWTSENRPAKSAAWARKARDLH